jgi:hypothetical protein
MTHDAKTSTAKELYTPWERPLRTPSVSKFGILPNVALFWQGRSNEWSTLPYLPANNVYKLPTPTIIKLSAEPWVLVFSATTDCQCYSSLFHLQSNLLLLLP